MFKIFLKSILLIFIILIPSLFYSQEKKDTRLHIKGKTFNSTGKVNDVSIRIIHDNGIVDTILSKDGKYNLHLEFNHKILLEFECMDENHYTKRIAFNTSIPDKIKKIPFFDLTINLVEKRLWNIKENDLDVLDLPVAYLNYDFQKKIWFDKNAKYSRVINKKIKSYGIY